jgi:hypothetical protein
MSDAGDDRDEYEDAETTRLRALNRWILFSTILGALLLAVLTTPMMVFGWIVGLVPFTVLAVVAWWSARKADEPVRFPVACTLLVATLIWWMMSTVALILFVVAVLVVALPPRAWRLHVVGPLMLSSSLVTILHPIDRWMIPPDDLSGFLAAHAAHHPSDHPRREVCAPELSTARGLHIMSSIDDEPVLARMRLMDWARRMLIASLAMTLGSFMALGPLSLIGWAIGAIPLVALLLLARHTARRADEPVRRPIAYALFVAALLWWPAFTVAAVLLVVGILVCALPVGPSRIHVLGPLMIAAVLLTILHPIERWTIPPEHLMFPGFWLLTLHTIALAVLVVRLCRLPSR